MSERRKEDLPKWIIGGAVIAIVLGSLVGGGSFGQVFFLGGGLGAFAGYALWRNDFRV